MRAPTITGDDGIERALILPVTNIDKLTSDAVDAEFGAPIFLDLGGRSIRDISKNARDQYLISAGTGDTDDCLKNWALYTWDGNPDHDPQMVKELPTDEQRIGAWEGIAELPDEPGRGQPRADDRRLRRHRPRQVLRPVRHARRADRRPRRRHRRHRHGQAGRDRRQLERRPTRADALLRRRSRTPPARTRPARRSSSPARAATFEGAHRRHRVHGRRARARTSPRARPTARRSKATPTQGAAHRDDDDGASSSARRSSASRRSSSRRCRDPNAARHGPVLRRQRDTVASSGPAAVPARRSRSSTARPRSTSRTSSAGPASTCRRKFTTANAENFRSSDSPVVPTFIDYRPKLPWVEIVSITGDRVAGSRDRHHGQAARLHAGGALARQSLAAAVRRRAPTGAANA